MSNNTKWIFPERLSELRTSKGISRQIVADSLGISRASLEYYEKGQRVPDITVLTRIADYFEVSADYLLGRSDVASVDPSQKMQAACEVTGLSEKAVEALSRINQQSKGEYPTPYNKVIDFLLAGAANSAFFGGSESKHKLNPCAALVIGLGDYISSTLSSDEDEADFLIINGKVLCSAKLENMMCDCDDPEREEEPITINLIKSQDIIEKVLFDRACEALKEVKNIYHNMNGGGENGSNNP